MMLRSPNRTSSVGIAIVLSALLAVVVGCAHARSVYSWIKNPGPYSTVSVEGELEEGVTATRPAAAMLVAARQQRVTMFGDLPSASAPAYKTRSAVSARQHTFCEEGADFDPTLDRTGKWLVFTSTRHSLTPDIYMKSVDGVAITQLTSDPASDIHPVISPDGTRLAFASDRGGNWDIWVMPIAGGQPVQVTHGASDDAHPSWSPDGNQLVYCSLPASGGQWELWLSDTTTGANRKFIGYGLFPQWSPVDDVILFQRARERGSHLFSIWTITLVDGEPRYPTELASSARYAMILPTFSNDGRYVAFTTVAPTESATRGLSAVRETSDIWLMYADGRSRIRLTDGYTVNHAPAFAPNGRLYITTNRSGRECVWSLLPVPGPSITGGEQVALQDARSIAAPGTRPTAAMTITEDEGP